MNPQFSVKPNPRQVTGRRKTFLWGLLAALLIAALGLVAFRLITGRSLGLRTLASYLVRPVLSRVRAVANQEKVLAYNRGEYTNIIFLHHSVGRNLIQQGGLREAFRERGYDFWDHDYNPIGLRDPQGEYLGYDYRVPWDNTDPDGLAAILSQPVRESPINTFSGLLQHEVIILKSCFPASNITSQAQLEQRKEDYLRMRAVISEHPEKLFILLTQPPLNPGRTDLETALRARTIAEWVASEEFLSGFDNLVVFNLFELLAEDDPAAFDYSTLRSDYRQGRDNHPNQLANQTIAPVLVDFVIAAIEQFRNQP